MQPVLDHVGDHQHQGGLGQQRQSVRPAPAGGDLSHDPAGFCAERCADGQRQDQLAEVGIGQDADAPIEHVIGEAPGREAPLPAIAREEAREQAEDEEARRHADEGPGHLRLSRSDRAEHGGRRPKVR